MRRDKLDRCDQPSCSVREIIEGAELVILVEEHGDVRLEKLAQALQHPVAAVRAPGIGAAGLPFGEHELAEPHTTSDPRCRLVPSWVHPGAARCIPVQRKISNLRIFLGVGGLF